LISLQNSQIKTWFYVVAVKTFIPVWNKIKTEITWKSIKTTLYNLRSSGSTGILLSMPAVRLKTLGDRAFMVAAPRLWNSLPKELLAITNVNSFKAHIKTYLFKTLYWWAILYSVLTCMHIYIFYFLFLNALSFICFF